MADATVTASKLNFREGPGGAIVGQLSDGDTVSILATKGNWLRVSAVIDGEASVGWIAAAFVSGAPATTEGLLPAQVGQIPPADDPAAPVQVIGNKAIGPDGAAFATVKNSGFITIGLTTVSRWLATNPAIPAVTPSVIRVMRAASLNEGRLEAINSYDNAFLSFGIIQWTAGTGDSAGELAGLLDDIARTDLATFESYFGRYGLGVQLSPPAAGWPRSGFLTLDGAPLQTPEERGVLRAVAWAYRFWRAGHDEVVRRCQFTSAAARIALFLNRTVGGRPVAHWLRSEYGIALVLDEHINRPGHVPGTLGNAIDQLSAPLRSSNPTQWGDVEEQVLIDLYIEQRDATNMTAPDLRAGKIADCVHDGSLSDQRGSFT